MTQNASRKSHCLEASHPSAPALFRFEHLQRTRNETVSACSHLPGSRADTTLQIDSSAHVAHVARRCLSDKFRSDFRLATESEEKKAKEAKRIESCACFLASSNSRALGSTRSTTSNLRLLYQWLVNHRSRLSRLNYLFSGGYIGPAIMCWKQTPKLG